MQVNPAHASLITILFILCIFMFTLPISSTVEELRRNFLYATLLSLAPIGLYLLIKHTLMR